jgi:hypothetical protein
MRLKGSSWVLAVYNLFQSENNEDGIKKAMQSISVYSCGPCCIASSHDGRNIVMGGPDGVLKVLLHRALG